MGRSLNTLMGIHSIGWSLSSRLRSELGIGVVEHFVAVSRLFWRYVRSSRRVVGGEYIVVENAVQRTLAEM